MQHTLLFLQPGHFHAALLVKTANERIARDLPVYATAGDERDDEPTDWKVHVHDAPSAADALDALIEQRRGQAVEPIANGYRFVSPHALHTTHESHFANELRGFLDHMDSGRWPLDQQALIFANQETAAP